MTRSRRRGFTLIELLIVMLLMAAVATVGSLRLRRRNRDLQTSMLAQEIFLRATRARLLALSNRGLARLVIDPTDSDGDGQITTVRAATQSGYNPVPLAFGPVLDQVQGRQDARVRAVSRGADMGGARPAASSATTTIVFSPDGSARIDNTGVSGATIYVQDDLGSNPARVVIFGRTGMAKIVNQ